MRLSGCLAFFFILGILWGQPIDQPGPVPMNPKPKTAGTLARISRIGSPIDLDGHVDPREWGSVDTPTFVSHWPAYSEKPNTRTRFNMAHDERFIYFSAICYDDPGQIQGSYFERDKWGMSMDQIAILLDTYKDNENGLLFVVTPTGSRIDVSVYNDGQGERPVDLSWNSYWGARVTTNEEGWMMEARIPFSSLRFQLTDGILKMGLIVYRYKASQRQMDIYPNIPPDWGFWSFVKPSKALEVNLAGVDHKRPWFTSPYALSGLGYHHDKLPGLPDYKKTTDDRLTAGLDVQHAVTDNMNLDLTLNTDFAQVEADDQVVNLSRFSLFFPEKRRFFLERSSIMDFGFDQNNRLFYSRRIGIQNGKIIPLWGGARVIGRIKNYDLGVMSMQSRADDEVPSENFGVFRLRKKISKNNSYVGGILTSRSDLKGNNNLAYGVDGILNLFKSDYLKFNFAQTRASLDTGSYSGFLSDRKRVYILWENRSQVGFNYALSYSQVDRQYDPGIGFEARNNYRAFGDRISYGRFLGKKSSLRYLSLDLNATAFYPLHATRVESYLLAPSVFLEWNKNNSLKLTLSRLQDSPPEAFHLGNDIEIGPGTYVNKDLTILYETPPVHFISSVFSTTIGSFYGGRRFSGSITPLCIISKYLTLSGFYQFNQIRFKGSPDYVAHIARLKIATSLNVKLSINTFVQVNSLTRINAINFRLRYNTKDGNDFYLVYNESLNDLGLKDPFIPYSDYRAFILKYVHTFQL